MNGQLVLFRQPGRRHITLAGIAAAGWTGGGQFYWDARRWMAGEHLPHLTAPQIAYLSEDRGR